MEDPNMREIERERERERENYNKKYTYAISFNQASNPFVRT